MYIIFSNIFVTIVSEKYKTAAENVEQMTIVLTHLFRFDKYNFQFCKMVRKTIS